MPLIKIKPLEQSETIYVDGSYVANIQAVEQGRSRSDLDMLTVTLKGDFGQLLHTLSVDTVWIQNKDVNSFSNSTKH